MRRGTVISMSIVALLCAAPAGVLAATVDRPGLYRGGQALPLVSSEVEIDIAGPFADVVVRQTFSNPERAAIEAVYVFPLPGDAAVSGMIIHTGTRTITARIARRSEARAAHEAAVAAGVSGALLEAERGDVFTQTVTGIAAGAAVTVELRWQARASRRAGVWELVYPLVLAPRFVPGRPTGAPTSGSGRAPDTDRAPDASRLSPPVRSDGGGVPIRLRVRFAGGVRGVECPSHDADVVTRSGAVELVIADARSDRDALVRWRSEGGGVAAVADPEGWLAVVVEAPDTPGVREPRDFYLVVDRSRSTDGETAVLTRQAVRAMLAALGPRDRLAVIDAAGAVVVPVGAAPQAAAAARTWIDGVRPAGAADLVSGLRVARGLLDEGGAPDAIVVVSDALVGNDGEVLAALDGVAAGVHCLGVGSAPNRWLLDALARRGGGGARFAAAGDDVAEVARAVIEGAAAPALAGVRVDWGALAVAEVTPSRLPALAAGDAAVVLARVPAPAAARVRIVAADGSSKSTGGTVELPARWRGPRLDRAWASSRITDLLAAGDAAGVERIGLAHGVVTPYTALVAVGEDVVSRGGVRTSFSVPVALPAGMRWQAVFGVRGEEADVDGDAEESSDAGSMPPPPTAPPRLVDRSYAQGELILISGRESAWTSGVGLTLGGTVLGRNSFTGVLALRLIRQLPADLAAGVEIAAIGSPTGDDRIAAALMAKLGYTGFGQGWLELDLGLGLRVAVDPGLGYSGALRFALGLGRTVGVLRWDGGVVSTGAGAGHRGALTLGIETRF